MRFVGREQEQDLLRRAYESPESALIPIYGRRRVGKSELILHFLEDRPGIYYLGKKAPAALQLRELLEEAASDLDEPLLTGLAGAGWREALATIVDRWPRERKLVLALDEFQWMVETSPELPSVLQELWDRRWREAGNVLLILCGSHVGFMEREILGRKSPLFGRRTAQILLRPFGFREAAAFHPGYSLEDRARTYFICGGVPFYLRFFSGRRSVEMNVVREILEEHAALHREPDFLLREELREVVSYHAVLTAVAEGAGASSDIARRAGLEPNKLHYYLKQLLELGYLRRRYPLLDKRPSTRHVRYDLDDPLLRFWFRFVFPNMSYILHRGAESALRDRIRPHLDAHYGHAFERLCREALPRIYAREGVTAAFEVGEFWSKESQIDVVGLRDDGWIDLGECKWGAVRAPRRLEAELEDKVRAYPNPGNATVGRHIFVRRRPGSAVAGGGEVRWHDLEDLYA